MPQGHFARAGAGAGANGLTKNKPETYNPGREKTAHENVSGRGWRYCAQTMDEPGLPNVGMPGRVNGRPPGGRMRLHPDVDSTTPFPPGEGTSAGPVQDPGWTGPTKRRPALRNGAPRAKIAEALRRASGDGDAAAVEEYLKMYAEYIDDPSDWDGRTALMECAHGPAGSERHLKTLTQLIANGANLDAQDKHGITAIHAFARRGFTMAVLTLMAAKADVNLADRDGITPLMAAAAAGKLEVVETLVSGEAPPPRWRDTNGPFQTADINIVDKLGRTAAVVAAQHGQQNCLYLLAATRGANLEATDRLEGSTVFHYACSKGWVDMAEHLLVCGADPSAKDEKGRTGMDLAVGKQRQDVEQRLRELVAQDSHRQLRTAIEAARYSMQETTWSRITPTGQVKSLANFTNDPSFLDPSKYRATFAAESDEFARPGRGGYADPDFRFPGPRGGAAQWQLRGGT